MPEVRTNDVLWTTVRDVHVLCECLHSQWAVGSVGGFLGSPLYTSWDGTAWNELPES